MMGPMGMRPTVEDPIPDQALLEATEDSMRGLRAALLGLYAAMDADPATPQAVSRQFGVTKSQAWKLAKIMGSRDAVEAARHVPGREGLRRVLEAFRRSDAPPERLEETERAFERFHSVVQTHGGDRASFALTLDSLRADGNEPAALEASRKLAFQGNSAILGISARLQLGLRVVVPSEQDPTHLCCANVAGLVDLRRLRPTVRWPLAHYAMRYADAVGPAGRSSEPLDGTDRSEGATPLLGRFCSNPLPPIRATINEHNIRYDLLEGPVGKAAAITCLFGMRFNNFASSRAAEPDEVAEHSALFKTPVEVALIDLLLHRDLPFELPPIARLYSRMDSEQELTSDRSSRIRLPLAQSVELLGSGPPVLATQHYSQQAALASWVVKRLGCSLSEFVGFRLVLPYPPIPSMLSLEHALLPPFPPPGTGA